MGNGVVGWERIESEILEAEHLGIAARVHREFENERKMDRYGGRLVSVCRAEILDPGDVDDELLDDIRLENGPEGDGLDAASMDVGRRLGLCAPECGRADLVSDDDKRFAGHAVGRIEIEDVFSQLAKERLAHLLAKTLQESVGIQLELNDHVYFSGGS